MKGRLTMKRLRPLHPTDEDPIYVETWGGGGGNWRKKEKKEEECPIRERRLHYICTYAMPSLASQKRLKGSSAAVAAAR